MFGVQRWIRGFRVWRGFSGFRGYRGKMGGYRWRYGAGDDGGYGS